MPSAKYLAVANGLFVPGDLSVRLGFTLDTLKKSRHQSDPGAASTFVHEMHHYHMTVGTTWGLVHLRYIRSWVLLGMKALCDEVVPLFKQHGRKVPFPLLRFCKTQDPLAKVTRRALHDFFKYTEAIYFELGLLPEIRAGEQETVSLPTLAIDEKTFLPFGTICLYETAARIEDRFRWDDFRFRRWPFRYEYDLLWVWSEAIGIENLLYVLIAIDLALNPVIPLVESEFAQNWVLPFMERSPAYRFDLVMRVLWDWQEKGQLHEGPDLKTRSLNRSTLDGFYDEIVGKLCETLNWKRPVDALSYYNDGPDEWTGHSVGKLHINESIKRRIEHSSIFAVQTLVEPSNALYGALPPFFLMFSDGLITTIKNPVKAAFENRANLAKSIVEQIICGDGPEQFCCPFCMALGGQHVNDCGAPQYWSMLGLNLSDFEHLDR